MSDYVSNCPISGGIHLPKIAVDADLNGVKFNLDVGMFFTDTVELQPLRLPPALEG